MASSASAARNSDSIDLPFVTAVLNFSQPIPRAYSNVPDPSKTYRPLEAKEVNIYDARPIRDRLDLDVQGFALFDHKSSVSHLRDAEALQKTYHEEGCALVKKISGADYVLPYRNYCQVRMSPRGAKEAGNDTNRPSGFVHADITRKTFLDWAKWVQQDEGVTLPPYSRACLYGAWRAVSVPPHDFPLTVGDARTHKTGNYVIMDNITSMEKDDHSVETRLALYDPDERYYYFSNMREDELLLFKVYDSKFNDAQTVMHTSFNNTKKWPNASPRESIEARFFAFWK